MNISSLFKLRCFLNFPELDLHDKCQQNHRVFLDLPIQIVLILEHEGVFIYK